MFNVDMSLKFILSSECNIAFGFTGFIRAKEMRPCKMIFKIRITSIVNIFELVTT